MMALKWRLYPQNSHYHSCGNQELDDNRLLPVDSMPWALEKRNLAFDYRSFAKLVPTYCNVETMTWTTVSDNLIC